MSSDAETPVSDVLVVDDNQSNILAIHAALDSLALRLVEARSGEEALRHLLHDDFAVILLDVQMPSMDGFETARLIRARERTRYVPIIFITAFDQQDKDVLQGYSLGAVDFLFKPIVPEVLRAKVSVFVELKRRAGEIARQAELLRQHEHLEHLRRLEEERQRWEAAMLRHQMEEQKRVAVEFARLNEQLKEADRRKDEFIAMLAHELRNPLAPIVIGIEIMESCNLSDPMLTRAHASMKRQIQQITRLVDDLLDVSRFTSGKIELRKEPVELSGVIQQAVDTVLPSLESQAHELMVMMPVRPVWLLADTVRLVQVVANLLSNAIRYTEPGGRIEVSCVRTDEQVVIRVCDNGRGIESEIIADIFDMFVQKREGGPGLGLGLTLVRRLVEMHEGSVTVTSEGVGQGSQFEVRLPLGEPPMAVVTDGSSSPVRVARCEGLRVVIIDDNADIRDMVGSSLERMGYQVEVASNGRDGLDLVIRSQPDVVLVDIGMPGMDGYQVAQAVHSNLPHCTPRLVAMTGFSQEKDRQRAMAAGFDAHLVKPTTQERLLCALMDGRRPP